MTTNVLLNVPIENLTRASLLLENTVVETVPLTEMRVHDNFAALLPNTAATDDLGLVMGTFGSASPSLQSVDFGGTTTTSYARFLYRIPDNWQSNLKVRCHAGMLTTVSDTTANLDVEVYKSDTEAGVGSDLVTTAAQSINSLTLADYNFTVNTAGFAVGDLLDVRLTFTGNDTGDAGVMRGIIGEVAMIMSIRG